MTRLRWFGASVAAALLLGGCGSPAPPAADATTTTRAPTTTATTALTSTTATTTTVPVVDLDALDLALQHVVTLEQPIALAAPPGSDLLLAAERTGTVRFLDLRADGTLEAGEPILDLSDRVDLRGEGGLLGIALSPDGTVLYAHWTDGTPTSHVDAYLLTGDMAGRTLLTLDQPFRNHNGGGLVVDDRGRLLIGLGDGGDRWDPLDHAQDRSTLFGTILRIETGYPEADGYVVPDDNPFVDDPAARPEILVWGLRNPWRFALDRATGDLWVADVGQDEVEEVTRIPAGELDDGPNLGWPAFEGDRRTDRPAPDDHRLPDITYPLEDPACSVTGGHVHRGGDVPDLDDVYLFGDFCDGLVRLAVRRADGSVETRTTDLVVPLLASFGEDGAGRSYALSLAGNVYRIVAGPGG